MASFKSLLACTKLVPLSNQISMCGPFLPMNWRTMIKSSAPRDGVTSRLTARVVRQVNRQPYSTISAPNRPTRVKVNGGWYFSSLALCRDPIKLLHGLSIHSLAPDAALNRELSIQLKSSVQFFGIFAGQMERIRPLPRIQGQVICNTGHAGWNFVVFENGGFWIFFRF